MKSCKPSVASAICVALLLGSARAGDGPIAVDVPIRTRPVDFDTEIAPILRANCLACHNDKKDSGSLTLESPQSMAKGGEQGAAIVAGKGAESLLLKVASHRQKPFMPPPDNKVGAKALTPKELGLIKLWIDQGAVGGAALDRDVRFEPLPRGYQPAFAAAITPDGEFAACSRGNRVFVYHVPTGKLTATLADPSLDGAAHRDVVRSLAFDAAGDLLASGGFREVKLWRRPRPVPIAEWPHEAPVRALAMSPDGNMAATGDERGRIRLWTIPSGKDRPSIAAHTAEITGLAFAADGTVLFSCSTDKTLRAWTVPDGSSARPAIETPAALHALVSIHGGDWLVTGDADGFARVWDASSIRGPEAGPVRPRREIKAHAESVTALAAIAAADGDFLTGGADGAIRRWHAETGNKVRELDNGAAVVGLAVRPDGRRIASAGPSFVKLFGDGAKPLATLQGDPRLAAAVPRLDAEIALTKAAIDRTKQDLKSYEGLERAVKVRGDDSKKAEKELAEAKKKRDDKQAALAKAAPDKKSKQAAEKAAAEAEAAVAVAESIVARAQAIAQRTTEKLADAHKELAAREDLLRKQQAAKSEAAALAKNSRLTIRALAFSSDNRRLAIGCDDGVLHFHDGETGAAAESQAMHRAAIHGLAFTKDGTLLSVAGDRRALVWNASSDWRLERAIGNVQDPKILADRVHALDFSSDGKRLLSGGGVPARFGELKIWNVADGRLLRALDGAHGDTVFGARFSPDGQRLASVAADRFVKVFDASSGEVVRVLGEHTAHVLGVSWRADGRMLVSCGADGTLKLWDVDTGVLLRSIKGGLYDNGRYKREVTSVAFLGDSEEILAASGDGTVRLHRVSSDNDIMKFAGVTGYQYAVAATPNGQAVIAAGSDGVLRVWSGHNQKPKHVFAP